MKQIIALICLVILGTGCMFVMESYSPQGEGYQFEGSCIGLTWDECRARADALCAEVGQTVSSLKQAGGSENKPGIAIIPKKVLVSCRKK